MAEAGRWEVNPALLEIKEKLGTGCTAEVYRGFHEGKEVAIKQIDWNKSRMAEKDQRAFDREVAISHTVKHANLVTFFGVSSLERPLMIVMEFCAGGCLFELLHNMDHVVLEWKQQHKMCADVADAMAYLHQFNPQIIHRDLKSLNLLLVKPIVDGADVPFVKVSDFGLSRMNDSADGGWGKMTKAAGTCHWMAPEVFNGTTYDAKVDVYSYGMILFEVICREIPFEELEPAEVCRMASEGKRPDMDAVPPDCPKILKDLMVTCWAPDPAQRLDFLRVVQVLEVVKTNNDW